MDPQKNPPPTESEQPNNTSSADGPAPQPSTPAAPAPGVGPSSGTPAPATTSAPMPGVAAPSWSTTNGGASSMPASGSGPRPKKKGLIVGLIIGLVVVILGGSAAAAYLGVVVPNKPENVLKTALANSFSLDKAKSAHFNGDFSITAEGSDPTFTGDFAGSADSDGAFEVKANVDAMVTKVAVDMRSVDGKSFYVKVGGLEGLPELLAASEEASIYAPMVAGLNEQWIEINESILRQMGVTTGTMKMTEADANKMAQAYADHQFLVFKEKLADEKIAGKDSHHFKVVIDKQQLKDFLKAVKDAKLDSVKLTDDDLKSFDDAVKNVDFNKYPADVWVSKDDKMIRQLKFTYSNNESTASFRYTVTDYNKPVSVTKPANAKSLLEVMSELFGGSTGDAQLMQELEGSGISL